MMFEGVEGEAVERERFVRLRGMEPSLELVSPGTGCTVFQRFMIRIEGVRTDRTDPQGGITSDVIIVSIGCQLVATNWRFIISASPGRTCERAPLVSASWGP
jgi:hypothetical protein